ncbi:MAG TPA: PfkB family carbohydrate kinase [Patescibacteria group bacterium]|nr:PfkB family carbohydrate kinase [Patescibacteria group bacterium]
MRSTAMISVISSWSTDVFVNQAGDVLAVKDGGPGLFLTRALAQETVSFKTHAASPVAVEILLTNAGELGRIPNPPMPRILDTSMFAAWTIVSSISEEWQFSPQAELPGRVCVDVQGFVRDPGNFGGKRQWGGPPGSAIRPYCLKGTRQEMQYIEPALLEEQKQRLLVITDGSEGVELYFGGERCKVRCPRVVASTDTVGAGDTFFGHFIARLAKGAEPSTAAKYAARQTVAFLERKSTNSTNPVTEV